MAALVEPSEDNVCRDVRIILGSVGVTPVRAVDGGVGAAGAGIGPRPTSGPCAEAVRGAVDPLEDFRGSPAYKTDMAEVVTRRAIEQALANAG